jgi:hypothetical protein
MLVLHQPFAFAQRKNDRSEATHPELVARLHWRLRGKARDHKESLNHFVRLAEIFEISASLIR